VTGRCVPATAAVGATGPVPRAGCDRGDPVGPARPGWAGGLVAGVAEAKRYYIRGLTSGVVKG
jgi:hypothetical protein